MEEIRASKGGALRVFFALDPRRHATSCGDKTGQWEDWYRWAIPAADDLYDTYLQELRDEGLWRSDWIDWTGEELMPTTKNYRELHEQVASRPGAA